MYETTPEEIKDNILADMELDTREGSFANDMVSAIAYEIWKVYDSLNAILPIAFVDETSGEYIDKRASEYGISRREGTHATVTLQITGDSGAIIPSGTVFTTEFGLEFETTEDATIVDTTVDVPAKSVDVGSVYNVDKNTITLQYQSLAGVDSVTNPAKAQGGTDVETDEALLARLNQYRQRPATSGNKYQYEQWAMEVSGVGGVKVTPLQNGPGTVGVLIIGYDKKPVDTAIVNACQQHIDSVRPIGAAVTVSSAQSIAINITVQVTLADGVAIASVQDKFKSAVTDYLESLAFNGLTVLINAIGALLMDIDGVVDYSNLQLNNTTANVVVADNQVPILGEVTMDESD